MKKSIKQPERIEKLIDVLLTCSFKFKKDLLSNGSALLEKLLTTSIGTQKIEKLFELGLNPKGPLSCGESILGQIILNTPPSECLNYFKAAESWLGEDFEKTLNYKNAKGESLAHLAFRKVNLEILEQLKERGMDWNITDKKENTPGHVLAYKISTLSNEGFAKKEKYLKACVFLTQNNFNWEVKNLRGFTPFDVFNSSTNPSLWSKIFSTIEKARLDQSLPKEAKTKPSQLRL